MDTSGLYEIVGYAGSLNGRGPLRLEHVRPSIRRLFEITGFNRHPAIDLRAGDSGVS